MNTHLDPTHYQELRARLTQLEAAAVRDLPAIDAVIEALAAEQRRLKTLDGQHGNNPIERRHHNPPAL
ncbi:MAG: hypothetical protein H7Y33_14830 [Cytophagales bacterium]|nr:hypothetical protein [Rhizobacter sp.]